MSLSFDDLQNIRNIVEETVNPIQGELKALSSDVKEIYSMISKLQNTNNSDSSNESVSVEDKILRIHSELVSAAKQVGVTLPNHQ